VLLIDKPKGLSSFDIIRRLRRVSPIRKIGHAGTLDPMATGLVICLSGRATKQMSRFMDMDKTYTGTIRLGQETPSYDAETEPVEVGDASTVTWDDIQAARETFLGDITQETPMYSAAKVGGERLYKKARRGETIQRAPRHVRIDLFDITERRDNDIDFRVVCSKGTYIRSLAHELGQHLGTGGHLTALRREAIGPWHVSQAWPLDELTSAS
jgi:tRNA pseudouridine55 synthase